MKPLSSKPRTTLILDRWAIYKKATAQTAHLVFASTKAKAKKPKELFYQRTERKTNFVRKFEI